MGRLGQTEPGPNWMTDTMWNNILLCSSAIRSLGGLAKRSYDFFLRYDDFKTP